MENKLGSPKGRMEFSISGHWSEADCFPAKVTKINVIKNQHEGTLTFKLRKGPIPVDALNIKSRDEAKLKAVAPLNTFVDLEKKYSVQLETSGIHNNYKSQCVVSGTPFAVSMLLKDTERLPQGTHGVLTDPALFSSVHGRYEKGKEFEIVKPLGKGGFGEVDLCKNSGGKHYVRKRITGQFRKKEVEVLMNLHHENITGFFGYILREGIHEILMEYGGLSLKEFVETQKWREMLPQTVVMQLAVQGFSALQYMHQYMVLHLDIKPENVCIAYDRDLNLVIKLTDFGTSHTPQQAVSHEGWTPEYMSPEACQSMVVSQRPELSSMFQNFELSGKSDVFSFCLTLYFMFEGSHVVLDIWKSQLDPKNFASFRLNFITFLAQFPDYLCEHIVGKGRPLLVDKLFALTLAGDPLKRLTAKEAKDFIQQYILEQSVTFPKILSPRSPESPPESPDSKSVDTCADIALDTMQSSMSPELDSSRPGGGKDIKNHLRQKLLLRQSTGPYSVDPARKLTSGQRSKGTERSEMDMLLPKFSALLDD